LAALAAAVRGCVLGQTEFDAAGQPGVPIGSGKPILDALINASESLQGCGTCPIADAKIQEVGLLWIGEQFYKSPAEFSAEAARMGLSRRITAIPQKFKLGETWVALAHRKAIGVQTEQGREAGRCNKPPFVEHKAGIFHVFKPSRIEYVVKADDDEAKLEAIEKRGITLVKVVKKAGEGELLCEVCKEPYKPTEKKPNHDCWKGEA
jgi:hypothetical protein